MFFLEGVREEVARFREGCERLLSALTRQPKLSGTETGMISYYCREILAHTQALSEEKEKQERIEANLELIRTYLKNTFPNYTLKEVAALEEYYMFTVTNVELYETFKLKVSGPRLSDQRTTSATIQVELERDAVARRMIEANGDYFDWT